MSQAWAEGLKWQLLIWEAEYVAKILESSGTGCEMSGDHRPHHTSDGAS